MADDGPPVDPWLGLALARARVLLERGEAASCLHLLREADRVAVAQAYPQVRPLIAELARQASLAPERVPTSEQLAADVTDVVASDPAPASGMKPRSESPATTDAAGVVSSEPVETRPHSAASPSPRHPNLRTLGLIWAAIFAAALVLSAAADIASDDPDASAGAGQLGGLVGLYLTFIYLAVSLLLHPRRRRHPSGWVVGGLLLGGIVGATTASLLGFSGDPLVPASLVLTGAYTVVSLGLRHDEP